MLRVALFATLALAGCGRSEGVSDEQLGNLVIAPKQKDEPVSVDKAAKDPTELTRALMQPYSKVVAAIGPHTYTLSTKTVVEEAGKVVSELSDQTTIELGDKGTYHALYNNSADYGREVTFVDGTMYLRPRYQRWHGRAPEMPEEPATVRDSFFEPIAATWDLLAPATELTAQGTASVGGRSGKTIVIKQAPSPRANPKEPLSQRAWREKRTIEAVTGEIVLDADTGVPIAAKLSGQVSFSRDGRRFVMKISLEAAAANVGQAVAIAAPTSDMVVATPERLREVDDRDYLLQGIAPPLRRNPDGSPVPPQPRGLGSAAGSASAGSAPTAPATGSNSGK